MLRPQSLANLLRVLVTIAGDALIACFAVAAIVTLRTHVDLPLTRELLPPGKFPLSVENLAVFSAAAVVALGLSGFYDFRVSPRHRPTLFVALPLQMALVAIAGTLLEISWPRTVFVAVPFLEAAGIPLWRAIAARFWPGERRNALVIGEAAMLRGLLAMPPGSIVIAGLVSLDEAVEHPLYAGRMGDARVLDLIVAAEEVIDLGGGDVAERRILLLEQRGPRGFLCKPAVADALIADAPFGSLGEHLLVQVSMPGAYGVGAVLKRIVDVALGSILLLVASPALIGLAILVAIDTRGPVLLRQRRVGLRGRPFLMWKFRTMHATGSGTELATDGDDRVTRVGRWLRRYRVDELPQLVNVVGGGMSLVGPRPEVPERASAIAREVPHFGLRLLVRPGLAGLAQTSAEYDQPSSVKLTYDLQYLCSWTPALDIAILVRAVVTALSGRGV
ncbi:MAG: sugar transferase [Thermoanaerobaculia bacterium]